MFDWIHQVLQQSLMSCFETLTQYSWMISYLEHCLRTGLETLYTRQVTTILRHTAGGQRELLYGTGDIQVNNRCVTLGFLYFVALLLSTMIDQLAPVIFSS